MSIDHPTQEQFNDNPPRGSFESMTPYEQLRGMLVVFLVLLLAIVLKSL